MPFQILLVRCGNAEVFVPSIIAGSMNELHGAIINGTSWHRADNYYHLNDFNSYREARLRALNDYKDRVAFGRKCLENIAAAGMFSSDRAVRQYAEKIWNV